MLSAYLEQIGPVHTDTANKVQHRLDRLTKPKGSLGRIEELAVQLGAITGETFPTVTPPGIIVMAADHGPDV
jgi:nicotinate-nucleotide--dimethylbenzimidazole phosphoribosyltransferase